MRLLILVAALLLAPLASAGSIPAIYFLRDAGPLEDGVLNLTVPDGPEPSARTIVVGQQEVQPVRFVLPEGEFHPDQILGPMFVGLWTGENTIIQGDLKVTLHRVQGDTWEPIGEAVVPLDADLDPSSAPDPQALLPPDPSDPEAVIYHEVAQLAPYILQPPMLLDMGLLDEAGWEGSTLGIQFELVQGSSPLPLPAGAFATIQYDGQLQPSFVYVPWYTPEPVAENPYSPPPEPEPTRPPATTAPPSEEPQGDNGIPGPGLVLVLVGIGLAIVARRR